MMMLIKIQFRWKKHENFANQTQNDTHVVKQCHHYDLNTATGSESQSIKPDQ